jgi:excisionase family DNA binding protein
MTRPSFSDAPGESCTHSGSLDPGSRDLGRLLITARQVAASLGVSLRTVRSWDSGGRLPRPVRIGRSTRWRAEELQRWTSAGCPRRVDWEAQT